MKELTNTQNQKHSNVLQNENVQIITDLKCITENLEKICRGIVFNEQQKPVFNRDGDESS